MLALQCGFILAATTASVGLQTPTFSDAHVHLNDLALQVELMTRFGIGRAVILRGRASDNGMLLRAAQQHPGRFWPFLSVSPEHREFRSAWDSGDPRLLHEADSMLSRGGFYGIGEISVTHFPASGFPEADYDPSGPLTRGLLSLARKFDLPIMLHIEITRLREFERLLADFPDVRVIWAHGGYSPLFLAERLLARYPNLYYELSARTWRPHPRSPDYTILSDSIRVWPQWLALIERLPERFLLGTDGSLRDRAVETQRITGVQLLLGQLSPRARRLVGSGSLEALVARK